MYKVLPLKCLFFMIFPLFVASCDIGRNNPGYEYFDDMTRSSAFETYTVNPNFDDGKTNQWLPEGTIPVTGAIYRFEKTEEDREKVAANLQSPIVSDLEGRVRGKEVYEIYCDMCHGEFGDGKGFLYTSKKYPYPPASLLSDKMRNEADGGLFHAITAGYGVMGAHGALIQRNDRWKVVLYIKDELQHINE